MTTPPTNREKTMALDPYIDAMVEAGAEAICDARRNRVAGLVSDAAMEEIQVSAVDRDHSRAALAAILEKMREPDVELAYTTGQENRGNIGFVTGVDNLISRMERK